MRYRLAISLALTTLVVWYGISDGNAEVASPAATQDGEPTLIVGVDATTLAGTLALAQDGDVVEIPAGTWEGPVTVASSITLQGDGVIDGHGEGRTLTVAAPGAIVRGLTIQNSGNDVGQSDACLYTEPEAIGAIVEGNTLRDCAFGIWVHETDEAQILDNDVTGRAEIRTTDRGNGIHLFDSDRVTVRGNVVRDARDGLYVSATDDSLIEGNHASDVRFGIHYMFSYRNTVRANVTTDSTAGIALMQSRELVVVDNIASRNERTGILFRDATLCTITGNVLEQNGQGMFFFSSTENTIRDNRLVANGIGVKVWAGSRRNDVANNAFVANSQQVFFVGAEDQAWGVDTPGNYWSDYVGWDQDGDGVGDRPHRVDSFTANLIHRYPSAVLLMRSPVMELLTHLEAQMPLLRVPTVVDHQPRVAAR